MPDVEEESTSWRIGKVQRMEWVWIDGQDHLARFLQQVLFSAQSLSSGVSCMPPYQGEVHSCRHGHSPMQVTKLDYEHQEPSLWKSLWKERRKSGLGRLYLVSVAAIRIHITHIIMRANNISQLFVLFFLQKSATCTFLSIYHWFANYLQTVF